MNWQRTCDALLLRVSMGDSNCLTIGRYVCLFVLYYIKKLRTSTKAYLIGNYINKYTVHIKLIV